MSPKRGDRVAPPAADGDWDVRFASGEAAKGWDDLCQQAAANTRQAWLLMRKSPTPEVPTQRHHPLKGPYAQGQHRGRSLPRWQIEVTAGGRIWSLVDADTHAVWVEVASTQHPKATE